MCICLNMNLCTTHVVCRIQKRALDPLAWSCRWFENCMCVLGPKPWSSARTRALSCWAISPAHLSQACEAGEKATLSVFGRTQKQTPSVYSVLCRPMKAVQAPRPFTANNKGREQECRGSILFGGMYWKVFWSSRQSMALLRKKRDG